MKYECSRCHQIVGKDGKARHELGRHQHHVVISERDGSESKPMGNFDYGAVEWTEVEDGA